MDVVVNPEFLREGLAMADILKPHLIVIGSSRRDSSLILEKYYRDFYETLPEIMHTNISTAEMIKYTNNAFLATKISFINSISNMCQDIPGADVNTIAHGNRKRFSRRPVISASRARIRRQLSAKGLDRSDCPFTEDWKDSGTFQGGEGM